MSVRRVPMHPDRVIVAERGAFMLGWLHATLEREGRITITDWDRAVRASVRDALPGRCTCGVAFRTDESPCVCEPPNSGGER